VRRAESMTSSFDQLIADILSQKNQKPSILSRFNNLNKFFSKEPQIHEKSQSTSLQKNFHR
jgi:hypothetical protein